MDERRKRIEETGERIKTTVRQRDETLILLGRRIWENRDRGSVKKPFESLYREIGTLESEIAGHREIIQAIQDAVSKRQEIETLHEALRDEMKSLDDEFRGTYEGIGRAVFGAHEEGLLTDSSLNESFESIEKLLKSIKTAGDELDRIGYMADQDKFFRKIAEKSRITLLKSKIRSGESRLSKLFQKTGKIFCSSEILKTIEDRSLLGILDPYRGNIDELEKLKTKDAEISSEKENVDEMLTQLGASRGGKKRIGELEENIERCESSMNQLFLETGTLFMNRKGKGFEGVTEVLDIYGEILGLHTTIGELEERVRVLETTLQIEGLKKRVTERDEDIRSAKEKIEALNAEIKEQQGLKKQLQSEIQHLEKTIMIGDNE